MSKIKEIFKKMWKSVFPNKAEEKITEVEEKKYFAPTVSIQETAPVIEEIMPVIPIKKKTATKKVAAKKVVKKAATIKKTTTKNKK